MSLEVTIPGTITTWVMQAVAINNKTGLGLATPLRIVGFREIFISLKLPYSVKRGEQFSVLITVYNYNEIPMRVSCLSQADLRPLSISCFHSRAGSFPYVATRRELSNNWELKVRSFFTRWWWWRGGGAGGIFSIIQLTPITNYNAHHLSPHFFPCPRPQTVIFLVTPPSSKKDFIIIKPKMHICSSVPYDLYFFQCKAG